MSGHCMESLSEALERLERRGFEQPLRARPGGLLELAGETPVAPETLVIEEVVRFEGESDPDDEVVLFALRSNEGRIRGTFVTSYGPPLDADYVAVTERLRNAPRAGDEHSQRGVSGSGAPGYP